MFTITKRITLSRCLRLHFSYALHESVEEPLCVIYMVDEVQGTYRGMMIAIAPEHWSVFADFELEQFASILQNLASWVRLKSFLKHTRAPKKKKDPPLYDPRHPHVSTAKLLAEAKKSP